MNNIFIRTIKKARSNFNSSLNMLKNTFKTKDQTIKGKIEKIDNIEARNKLYHMINLHKEMCDIYKKHDFELKESKSDIKNRDAHKAKAEKYHALYHIKSEEFHKIERILKDEHNISIEQIHKIVY